MTKKVFTGERQNLHQLAKDVEEWLRQQGFEVQSGRGDGTFLVQARKQSTWRSLLGNNQSINVKIEGTPENYSIDLDAGQWVTNLTDSGGAGIVAALATMYTLGIAAAWSASERSKIESALWAQKDASCPACFRIGSAVGTGEKLLRAEGITLQPSGVYQGTKVFTDTFKCRFCSHTWDRNEKPRLVTLCPKCYDEKAPRKTGEKVITCKKTGQQSPNGQPVGEQVFRETFQCTACSHAWEGEEKKQLVEICPACLKTGTWEATGAYVFSLTRTDQWSERGLPLYAQTFTNTFRCRDCSHEWNDGQHSRLVELCPYCEKVTAGKHVGDEVIEKTVKYETGFVTDTHYREYDRERDWIGSGSIVVNTKQGPMVIAGHTRRQVQMAVEYEVFRQRFKCNLCGLTWSNDPKTRRVE